MDDTVIPVSFYGRITEHITELKSLIPEIDFSKDCVETEWKVCVKEILYGGLNSPNKKALFEITSNFVPFDSYCFRKPILESFFMQQDSELCTFSHLTWFSLKTLSPKDVQKDPHKGFKLYLREKSSGYSCKTPKDVEVHVRLLFKKL